MGGVPYDLVPHLKELNIYETIWSNSLKANVTLDEAINLPEKFPIVGEELGFIGIFILFILFWFLFTKGLTVVREAPDLFSMFLSFGILISVMIYFLVNAAYVVGFAPTTGLPMPFISYGGSHIIFTFISMGILLNIARKGRSVTNSYYRGFSYE